MVVKDSSVGKNSVTFVNSTPSSTRRNRERGAIRDSVPSIVNIQLTRVTPRVNPTTACE